MKQHSVKSGPSIIIIAVVVVAVVVAAVVVVVVIIIIVIITCGVTGEKGFYLAIGGAIIEHSLAHLRTILEDHKFNCTIDDVSDDMTMISVQGPRRWLPFY